MSKTKVRQKNVTSTQSLEHVKILLNTSLSTICYLRNVYSCEEFKPKEIGGTTVHSFESSNNPAIQQLINWFETGVLDALTKKYLHRLIIGICTDPTRALETAIETYEFDFSYGKKGTYHMNFGTENLDIAKTRNHTRDAINTLVRRLITMIQTLPHLDNNKQQFSVSFHMMYTKETPKEYHAPNFSSTRKKSQKVYHIRNNIHNNNQKQQERRRNSIFCVTPPTLPPTKRKLFDENFIGRVATPHHCVQLHIKQFSDEKTTTTTINNNLIIPPPPPPLTISNHDDEEEEEEEEKEEEEDIPTFYIPTPTPLIKKKEKKVIIIPPPPPIENQQIQQQKKEEFEEKEKKEEEDEEELNLDPFSPFPTPHKEDNNQLEEEEHQEEEEIVIIKKKKKKKKKKQKKITNFFCGKKKKKKKNKKRKRNEEEDKNNNQILIQQQQQQQPPNKKRKLNNDDDDKEQNEWKDPFIEEEEKEENENDNFKKVGERYNAAIIKNHIFQQ